MSVTGIEDRHYVHYVMNFKWELRELACKLRGEGLSYKEIRKKVPVSKSTISRWCNEIELTLEQKLRLGKKYDTSLKGAKAVQGKRRLEVNNIISKAREEVGSLKPEELKLMGAVLYWAEGNKSHFAGITNSDPGIIKVMMRWFREICKVPESKFKAQLHIHSGQDENMMKRFWSSETGIPLSQFCKSFVKKEGTGHRKNTLYNGTLKINIYDKDLLYKILGWIEGVSLKICGRLAQ